MAKKILVLYYTQSGQLGDILNNFLLPLKEEGHSIETIQIHPETEYTFPWTSESFFSVMPDCVLGNTRPLKKFQLQQSQYDLIVIGYQAWFLSPSIPINSLLQLPEIKNILKATPVITITGARNMWISALERIKKQLTEVKAKHIGNIALVDKNPNLVSVITILYWMFSGKRDRLWGIFPKPGVSDIDIEHMRSFGKLTNLRLQNNNWNEFQNELIAAKSVIVKYNLMFTESKATKLFRIWANFIVKRKNKTAWLVVFKYYLLIALFVVAPVILTINTILFKPFYKKRIKNQLAYYSGVNYSNVI